MLSSDLVTWFHPPNTIPVNKYKKRNSKTTEDRYIYDDRITCGDWYKAFCGLMYSPLLMANSRCFSRVLCGWRTRFLWRPPPLLPPPSFLPRCGCETVNKIITHERVYKQHQNAKHVEVKTCLRRSAIRILRSMCV